MADGFSSVVESHYPGRMRVRVPRSQRNSTAMENIRSQIVGTDGVRNIYTNTSTGGVLVEYDPGVIDPQAILELGRAANLISDIESFVSRGTEAIGWKTPSPSAQQVIDSMRKFNSSVLWMTRGLMDARMAVPLVLLALSIGRALMSEQRSVTPWHSLMWYAYSVFVHWNHPMNGRGASA